VLDRFRFAGQQLEKLRVVHDFGTFGVVQNGLQGFQHLAFFVHPHGSSFTRLRGHFNPADARPKSLRFAFAGFQVQPNCQ